MVLGLVCALVAAVAYGSATILQALGVRAMAAVPEAISAPRRLWSGRLYAAGLGLDAAGFVLTFIALRDLPIFLVESATASSVAITAVLATFVLGVVLSRRELVALAVVGIGLVLLAISAQEGAARVIGTNGLRWIGLASIPVLLLALGASADRNRGRSANLLAVSCGLGFGLLAIGARVVRVDHGWWHLLAQPEVWAIIVGGAVGILAYGFALARGRAVTVTAITFATETVVPAVIGLSFLGDGVRSGFWPLMIGGFVLTLGGCIALAGQAEQES
ncbi:hypothetical protein [Calidifontibacter terrae]